MMRPMMMMNGMGIATRYAVELKTNLRILRVTWSLDLPMTMNPPFLVCESLALLGPRRRQHYGQSSRFVEPACIHYQIVNKLRSLMSML